MVYAAVLGGELEIDAEGRIWRVAIRQGNRWNSGTTLRSCPRHRAEHPTPKGYLQIRLMTGGLRAHALAHRLVYVHLVGPIPDGETINHIDGVKSNNRPGNLEPATHSEQILHAIHVLGKSQAGERNPHATLTDAQVIEIRGRRGSGESLKSVAADYGIHWGTVSKIALSTTRSTSR